MDEHGLQDSVNVRLPVQRSAGSCRSPGLLWEKVDRNWEPCVTGPGVSWVAGRDRLTAPLCSPRSQKHFWGKWLWCHTHSPCEEWQGSWRAGEGRSQIRRPDLGPEAQEYWDVSAIPQLRAPVLHIGRDFKFRRQDKSILHTLHSDPIGSIFQGAYMKIKIYFPSLLTLIVSYTFKW